MDDEEQEDLLIRASSDNEDFTDNEDGLDSSRRSFMQDNNIGTCYDKLRFISIGLLLLLSSTALIILLPLYTESVDRKGDAYTSILFTCSFTVINLFIQGAVAGKFSGGLKLTLSPPFTLPILLRTGLLYGASSFLIIYALDRKRVVCHLQDPIKGIILVLSLVYYFFFCRKMMGLQKIFCSTTIIVGLFISVDYGLCDEFRCRGYEREHKSEDAGKWSWQTHSVWTLTYIFGLALWSLHYTLLEGLIVTHADMLFATAGNSHLATVSRLVSTRNTITQHSRPLLQITEEDQDVSTSNDQPDQHRHVTYMKPRYDPGQAPPAITIALWTHIISFLLVVSLCWTDMVPVIGKGSSASNFWNLSKSGLLCHFGYDSHILNPSNSSDVLLRIDSAEACHQIVLFAWPFAISYLVFVLSSTQFLILSESSVFTVAMMTTALPLSGIWWSLFRMVGLSAQSNGELIEWSPMVTGELICSVLGLPIVLVGLILLFKAHFRERSYGKFVITCLRRQPVDH